MAGDQPLLRNARAEATCGFVLLMLGLGLRVWRLGEQIPLGDEMWTVRAVTAHGPLYLLTHHHSSDFSAPLALANWLALGSLGLSEWTLRLPVLLLGVLTLPVAWWVARRELGGLEALAVGGLAACSPSLISYSRFDRPYAGVALCVLLALGGWAAWRRTGRLRWGAVSAAAGAAGLFFNATALPAVAALWAAGLAGSFGARRAEGAAARPGPLRSALVVAAGALLAALAYAPSLASLLAANLDKPGTGTLRPESWWGALHFLLGTRSDALLAWLLASVAVGAASLRRRNPWLLGAIALMTLAQAGAVALASPFMVHWSYVLGRYLLAALPGLLILVGAGLAAQGRLVGERLAARIGRGSGGFAASAITLLFLATLALSGPLPSVYRGPNAFTNHPDAYAGPTPPPRPERFPAFYAVLSRAKGEGAVVEAPWPLEFRATPYGLYQRLHRRPVLSASEDPVFEAAGVRFRRLLPVSALAAGDLPAEYVILAARPAEETLHVQPGSHPGRRLGADPSSPAPFPAMGLRERLAAGYRRALAACRENPKLREVYADEWVSVFANGPDAERRARDGLRAAGLGPRRAPDSAPDRAD